MVIAAPPEVTSVTPGWTDATSARATAAASVAVWQADAPATI
jgi:hypothetical protein